MSTIQKVIKMGERQFHCIDQGAPISLFMALCAKERSSAETTFTSLENRRLTSRRKFQPLSERMRSASKRGKSPGSRPEPLERSTMKRWVFR